MVFYTRMEDFRRFDIDRLDTEEGHPKTYNFLPFIFSLLPSPANLTF